MKTVLLCTAGILFLAPLVVWGMLSTLSCAYVSVPSPCAIRWASYLDWELLGFVALPWILSLLCTFFAITKR